MERDYIGNLKVLAAINRNTISEQNLKLLEIKYSLSDSEMHNLVQYCKDQGIEIYDEEKRNNNADDESHIPSVKKKKTITTEELEHNKMASSIAERIMHIAAIKALKRVNGRGWLCGTYTNSVRRTVERQVKRCFSLEESKFIIDHLPDENDEDEIFTLVDQDRKEMCEALSKKLNEIIPRLHVNLFYTDFFDD